MKKNQSVSDEYMTVGELAGKMGTTVRTLQYYDKEHLLPPSAESEGGRRLYTYKDMIRLHQIQSLKSLGFSLDDIRNRLIPLNTPEEVADMLTHQGAVIREKIDQLTNALEAVEALKQEVLQMQSVDFKKYADIIVNLQMKNEYYWLIKHFDDDTLDHIRRRFDKESGIAFMERFEDLNKRILRLKENGISPEDSRVQEAAEEFWKLVMEFTGGDMSLLPKLMEAWTGIMPEMRRMKTRRKRLNGSAARQRSRNISSRRWNCISSDPVILSGRNEYEVCNTDLRTAQKLWQYRGIKRN